MLMNPRSWEAEVRKWPNRQLAGMPDWKKKQWLRARELEKAYVWGNPEGENPISESWGNNDPNAQFRKNPFPGMDDPNWSVASTYPAKTPHTPMAGKKGLSMKNMINAMSKLKSPTGEDFGKAGGRVGGARPSGGDPLTGLSATYPYTGVTKPSNEAIERLRKWGY